MFSGFQLRILYLVGAVVCLFCFIFAAYSLSTADAAAAAEFVPVFQDVSGAAGISATHTTELMIIGQAWGDVNQDGWPDLFVTDDEGPNTLYLNDGDSTFSVSPNNAQVAMPGMVGSGAVFGDYNNDDWPDLYVLNVGPNMLFMNNGGNGFVDVTSPAGVGDGNRGQTGAWGDYDKDGFLDLYVVNYNCTACPNGNRDTLYHNNGDGTFSDVTGALIDQVIRKPGFTGSFLDYDNDGDLDIYVVNDFRTGNVLWRNDGPGCNYWCFTDVSLSSGADTRVDGMGLAIGDYDIDGDLDLYFSHNGPAVLLQNQTSQGSPTFVDGSAAAGVNFAAIGWGTVFFDFDNDGWLDLYLATGNAIPAQANRLFRNLGNGAFEDKTADSGADNTDFTMGVAYADYDRNGMMDLVIGNRQTDYVLYQNQGTTGGSNNWLQIKLVGGRGMNRDAIGARAYVHTSDGRVLMQEVKSGSSIGAGNDLLLHFGLGVAVADSVVVIWPNGMQTTFDNVPLNTEWLIAADLVTTSFHLPLVFK